MSQYDMICLRPGFPMQPFVNVNDSLTPSHDRTRSPHAGVSPHRAIAGLERALYRRPAPSLEPGAFASALYRRLQMVERRQTWMAFCRVLARCASVLVLEGD
jgi:hypothetical protein